MKAYAVTYLVDKNKVKLGHDLVYGKDLATAEHNFFNQDSLLKSWSNKLDQSNVRFGRLKELDNTEKLSTKEIAEKLIKQCNWHWTIGHKHFDKENFNKHKFEKAWENECGETA